MHVPGGRKGRESRTTARCQPLLPPLWADGPGPRAGWAETRGSPPGPTGLCLSSRGSGRAWPPRGGQSTWAAAGPASRSPQPGPAGDAASSIEQEVSSQGQVSLLSSSPEPCLDLATSLGIVTWPKFNWCLGGTASSYMDVCEVSVDFPGVSRCDVIQRPVFPNFCPDLPLSPLGRASPWRS